VAVNYEKGWWIRSARQLKYGDPNQFLHQIAPILKTSEVTYKKDEKKAPYSIPDPFSTLQPMTELKGINFDQVYTRR
jgi:hypothetical protein